MILEDLLTLIAIAQGGPSDAISENARRRLLAEQLVLDADGGEITERGRVFLDHLERLPLPVSVNAWRMPMALALNDPATLAAPSVEAQQPRRPHSVTPKVAIPTDPQVLGQMALRFADQGYSLGEVKAMLELTGPQMAEIFGMDV